MLVGGLNGRLGLRHLAYATKTVTTGNLLLSLMDFTVFIATNRRQ
jgi:hypothetical protein